MRKKQRYTKERIYSLIRKWESSGLTQEQFFKEHKISKSTFGYWRKKYLRDQTEVEAPSKIIPVHIIPPDIVKPATPAENIEIVYPNGVRVLCPSQVETSRIKALIN